MFFGKHKIIDTIKLKLLCEESRYSEINIEKMPSGVQIIIEWITFSFLFVWGILEFELVCTKQLLSSSVYWVALIIMIVSGLVTISQTVMMCCGATMSIVKQPRISEEMTESLIDEIGEI
jgi:hypothetical protein